MCGTSTWKRGTLQLYGTYSNTCAPDRRAQAQARCPRTPRVRGGAASCPPVPRRPYRPRTRVPSPPSTITVHTPTVTSSNNPARSTRTPHGLTSTCSSTSGAHSTHARPTHGARPDPGLDLTDRPCQPQPYMILPSRRTARAGTPPAHAPSAHAPRPHVPPAPGPGRARSVDNSIPRDPTRAQRLARPTRGSARVEEVEHATRRAAQSALRSSTRSGAKPTSALSEQRSARGSSAAAARPNSAIACAPRDDGKGEATGW